MVFFFSCWILIQSKGSAHTYVFFDTFLVSWFCKIYMVNVLRGFRLCPPCLFPFYYYFLFFPLLLSVPPFLALWHPWLMEGRQLLRKGELVEMFWWGWSWALRALLGHAQTSTSFLCLLLHFSFWKPVDLGLVTPEALWQGAGWWGHALLPWKGVAPLASTDPFAMLLSLGSLAPWVGCLA